MTDEDGHRLAQVAMDALAKAQERTADARAILTGIVVTLVVQGRDGTHVVTQASDDTAPSRTAH